MAFHFFLLLKISLQYSTFVCRRMKRKMETAGKVDLFLDPISADIRFVIANDAAIEIPAHKAILAANSSVFYAMFFGPLRETSDTIQITDVHNASSFSFVLKYCYDHHDVDRPSLNDTDHDVNEIIYLAEKYNIELCVEDCVQHLRQTLNDRNVYHRMELALLLNQNVLRRNCERLIILDTAGALASEAFTHSNKIVLKHILLNMAALSCSESQLFDACMRWVRTKCQEDGQTFTADAVEVCIGDVLRTGINFGSMTNAEIDELRGRYVSVFRRVLLIANGALNAQKRIPAWNRDEEIRVIRLTYNWSIDFIELSRREYVVFAVTQPLLLGHFNFAEIYRQNVEGDRRDCQISGEISLIERGHNPDGTISHIRQLLISQTVSLNSNGSNIVLNAPVLLRPRFTYTLRMECAAHNGRVVYLRRHLITNTHPVTFHELSPPLIDAVTFNRI